MVVCCNTKEQIIDKALQLMLQKGINGFSYRDISEPLGIKNAAIHYHFPTKSDLIKLLIEENLQRVRKNTAEFMAYGGPALPQLENLFSYVIDQYKNGRPICLIGALSVDYDDLNDSIKAANDQFLEDSAKWLNKVLETGRAQQEFSFSGPADRKAMGILAMIQGARQIARMHGIDILENIFTQVRADLGIT